ncbi:ribosome biogenesis GTPase YqeH [Enterococcus nangangensis]|uniref:ribosome biogenesis GTPase YqeH n=1 Tax=Enterococcus nangangensis TaxID=2559926 RepID=UPI001BB1AAF6|nr:ribosome biogenesis GTPase YqeH [Enterococcus nangangensis]
MTEELFCIGCGAKIQTTDPKALGYTPQGALEKGLAEEQLYCQRCFRLRHYNEIADVSLTDDDFLHLLNEIRNVEALIVNMVDIFDFNGSLIPGLHRFVGDNPVLLVANKVDLLPKSTNLKKLKNWLLQQAHKAGLRPVDVLLTTSQKVPSIMELLTKIEKYRQQKDVYVVGVTNVGKSSLINGIIKQTAGMQEVITTSRFPGTTLDKIEIPIDDGHYIVDTPGIIHRHQMAHLLEPEELKSITPLKEIKARTYQLQSEQTLFMGGLARFDFVTKEKASVTCYFANGLDIHRRKTSGSDEFYAQHCGELLMPPLGKDRAAVLPPLHPQTFKITEKSDIVFSGLGFITVKGPCQVTAYAPQGIAVMVRQAII